MSTSGGGTLNACGYIVILVCCLGAGTLVLGDLGPWLRRPRPVATALWLIVAVPSVVELAWHPIYEALARRPHEIRDGQVWRLLTSVTVQDGGLGGTIFNLVMLALIVTVAAHLWGPARTVALLVIGALLFNVLATFAYPSPGGGNSGATFFLATSITGLVLAGRRSWQAVVAAIVTLGAGVLLLGLLDAHSIPILAGLTAGVALALIAPPAGGPIGSTLGRSMIGTADPGWSGTDHRVKMGT
jgi:hypothetical protein